CLRKDWHQPAHAATIAQSVGQLGANPLPESAKGVPPDHGQMAGGQAAVRCLMLQRCTTPWVYLLLYLLRWSVRDLTMLCGNRNPNCNRIKGHESAKGGGIHER